MDASAVQSLLSFFFSSRRRHTRFDCDWSSDVCSSDLGARREARAMRDMARAELLNLRNETVAQIIETRARAEQDRNLARLYQTGIVPQARAAVQTSLASYRVGRLSFMQLIDNQMTVNRYETETYRLLADYHQAVGDLEALVGGPLEPQP